MTDPISEGGNVKEIFRKYVPMRARRMFRKYVSPLLKDAHYYEYEGRRAFFQRAFTALAFNGIDGDYTEFGCCGGTTFGLAYKYSRKQKHSARLWAFDSFCGLPSQTVVEDEHPIWIQGSMSIEVNEFVKICREKGIPKSKFTVVPGFYEKTLAEPDSQNLPVNICLAYIDCDLYSSTKVVLHFLSSRLKHGMIIAFDDYYCWSSTQVSGERKACAEFFKDHPNWILVPFMTFGGGGGGMSFVVESRNLSGSCGSCY
jgi:O-methyltransferase